MVRRKVWNEHIKLLATLINAIAIGILGVAVIGPLAQPDNPFYGWTGIANDKFASLQETLTPPSLLDVVEWKAILLAITVHLLAHLVLRGQVDEQP